MKRGNATVIGSLPGLEGHVVPLGTRVTVTHHVPEQEHGALVTTTHGWWFYPEELRVDRDNATAMGWWNEAMAARNA